MITNGPEQEPIIHVNIEGKMIPMMIDTGATCTCIRKEYASHLPLSGQYIQIVGFSGKTMLNPTTKPVTVIICAKLEIVVCKNSPVNLLGRDAILALGLKLNCKEGGIDLQGIYHMRSTEPKIANVYWLGDIATQIKDQVWNSWEKYVEAQIPQATNPEFDLHCTCGTTLPKIQTWKGNGKWRMGKGNIYNPLLF